MLQESTEDAAPATFLFVVAATGQAARETTNGVLNLIDGSASLTVSSYNGQAFGDTADGVLNLVEGSSTATLLATALLLGALRLTFAASAFAVRRTVVVLGVTGLHGGRRAFGGCEEVEPE